MCIFRHTHIAVVAAVVCQAAGGSIWRPMTPGAGCTGMPCTTGMAWPKPPEQRGTGAGLLDRPRKNMEKVGKKYGKVSQIPHCWSSP